MNIHRFLMMSVLLCGSLAANVALANTYRFTCNLNGKPATMISQLNMYPDGMGGFITRTAGEIRGQNVYYTYVGQGEFADIVDHTTNQRFRIRFELAPGGVFIVANPFESGHGYEGSGRYWCQAMN